MAAAVPRWLLLVHQLPPRPLYLRAKIRQRLERVGALALKNSVYVLPEREDCLEDLQWIAQEAEAGGGSAFVCRVEMVQGVEAKDLVQRFNADRAARYRALRDELRPLLRAAGGADPVAASVRARRRLDEIRALDFFGAPERKEVQAMVERLQARRAGTRGARGKTAAAVELVGRVWVTRKGPKVDRLATAWLVRRFIDPRARFRFVEAGAPARPHELRFDMVGGDVTHEGERCTFETLLARAAIDDPALRPVAEIVHDIDLKDGRYGRAETAGFQRMLEGLVRAHADDDERLAHGLALFVALYASFEGSPAAAKRRPQRARPRRRP